MVRNFVICSAVLFLTFCLAMPAVSKDKFAYDALGRLIRVDHSGGAWAIYDYDRAGNRVRVQSSSVATPPNPYIVANNDVVYLGAHESKTILVLTNDIGVGLLVSSLDNYVGPFSVDDDVKVVFWGAVPGVYGVDYTIVDDQGRTATAHVTVYVN